MHEYPGQNGISADRFGIFRKTQNKGICVFVTNHEHIHAVCFKNIRIPLHVPGKKQYLCT